MTDDVKRILPEPRRVISRTIAEQPDPYTAPCLLRPARDGVYRFIKGPEGGIARVERLTDEELDARELPKKKPKTNGRRKRFL